MDFLKSFPKTEQNFPLAPLTTLKVGGPADLYYKLTDIEELPTIIKKVNNLDIPYFILGGGSNLVFHDDGFRGLVIHIKANQITVEKNTIIADAGALVSQIILKALKNNLSGIEKLTGLPGTIGGAVRGNAGAFGIETKDLFNHALIYNEENGLHEVQKDYFNFNYRSSTIKSKKGADVVLRVHLKLELKSPEEIKQKMKETTDILRSRTGKQPAGKTTGSFFKNPNQNMSAGYLLEQAGCKGLQEGQAQVSQLHANWVMNLGEATQKDILELSKIMQQRVKEHFNIILEPEVQFVGKKGI